MDLWNCCIIQAKKVDENGPSGLIPSQTLEEKRKAFVRPEYDYTHKSCKEIYWYWSLPCFRANLCIPVWLLQHDFLLTLDFSHTHLTLMKSWMKWMVKGQGHEIKRCDFRVFDWKSPMSNHYSLWCDVTEWDHFDGSSMKCTMQEVHEHWGVFLI